MCFYLTIILVAVAWSLCEHIDEEERRRRRIAYWREQWRERMERLDEPMEH